MKRRRLIAALGGVIAGGSTIFSTSAFTSVSAERNVSVEAADDDRAFLRLEPITDEGFSGKPTGRSRSFGGQVSFSIPGNGGGESDAQGVGTDSEYEFRDLLEIINQGTQPVEVFSKYSGDNLEELALIDSNGSLLRESPPTLEVGEGVDVGLFINTHGTAVDTEGYDETLTIIAEAEEN